MSNIKIESIKLVNIKPFNLELNNKDIAVFYDKNGTFDALIDLLNLDNRSFENYYYFDSNIFEFNEFDLNEWKINDVFVIDSNSIFFSDLSIKDNIRLSYDIDDKSLNEKLFNKLCSDFSLDNDINLRPNEVKPFSLIKSKLLISILCDSFLILVKNLNILSKDEQLKTIELIKKYHKNKIIVISSSNKNSLIYGNKKYILEKGEVTIYEK